MKAPYLYPHDGVHHRSGISVALRKLPLVSIGFAIVAAIIFGIMIEHGF
jgi:hypothetical protein